MHPNMHLSISASLRLSHRITESKAKKFFLLEDIKYCLSWVTEARDCVKKKSQKTNSKGLFYSLGHAAQSKDGPVIYQKINKLED